MNLASRHGKLAAAASAAGLTTALLAALVAAQGCSAQGCSSPGAGADAGLPVHDGAIGGAFCDLPGSAVHGASGKYLVGGGPASPDLSWLELPEGFCVHYFGNVGDARQLRFAPGGELFVASPTASTTGGNAGAGAAAIVVLPDDNGDGFADANLTFLGGLPSTQGLLFANDSLYYQDDALIRKLPYKAGDRTGAGPGQVVLSVTVYHSFGHWPKTLDIADDGSIYVGNGGDQSEMCDPTRPFHGGILKIDGTPDGELVARGLRNPIAVRCQRGHGHCYATELARDYSDPMGGREKLFPIHSGDDWGYNCCATQGVPYTGETADCSKIAAEQNTFLIGDTPFGLEFEPGRWPEPWRNSAFVALHGAFASWTGARLVGIATDPTTGVPLPSATDMQGKPTGGAQDLALGWDDGGLHQHGRPAALAMSPDGRLFVANDVNGEILWIAPVGMGPKATGPGH